MIRYKGLNFDIPDKCDKCNQMNDIIRLQGGGYVYYCDCFPLKSERINPIHKELNESHNEVVGNE